MKKYLLFGLAALFVVLLDQASKLLVLREIAPDATISIIPGFFSLVHYKNRGAAFGFLNRADIEWQFWLFTATTLLALGLIFIMARQTRSSVLLAGLGLILGGALGNFIDRIRFRAVVDFLDFYWQDWHWPAFNVADMAICCGAFLTCAAMWKAGWAK